MNLRILLALVLSTAALSAYGHPFHGGAADFPAGLTHPFLGLDHLLAAVAVGIWATRLAGRAVWMVPLAFVCGTLGGSFIGLATAPTAVIELAVAASVVAFGVLVWRNSRTALLPSAAIAAVFALFHGIVHTAGASFAGSPVIFIGGLAAGTALLHASGVAAAVAVPRIARTAGVAIALAGCCLIGGAVL